MKTKQIKLKISGMTCPACASHATKSLSEMPGVDSVEIKDWKSGLASIRLQRTQTERSHSENDWNAALKKHGYTAKLLEDTNAASHGDGNAKKAEASASHTTPRSRLRFDTDLVVIGTGGGGMGAALEAARLGKRVTIIEKETIGGCCVNVGCIPSKSLIQAAHLRHDALSGRFSGLAFQESENNWQELLKNRHALVEGLRREKYERVLDGFEGITLKRAQASFGCDPDGHPIVLCDDGSKIRAQKYVIATGSRPQALGLPGEEKTELLDSTTALFMGKKPDSLAVIGGGFVAVELTQALSRLGVPIVGMAVRSRLLSKWDIDISAALQKSFESEGIPVQTGLFPVRFFREGALKCVELEDATGKRQTLKAQEILLAAGRVANTQDLGIESLGIVREERSGKIPVSPSMQTKHPAVYAVGDASSLPNLVYVAARSGKIAASHAFGEAIADTATIDAENIPEVVFTNPECAQVGLTLAQAIQKGIEAKESMLDVKHIPRNIVANQTGGFVKLVADAKKNTLLGAHVFSPRAGELIQTASLAIAMGKRYGFTVEAFQDMLFAYLTESEGLKLSAQTFRMDLGQLSCCAG